MITDPSHQSRHDKQWRHGKRRHSLLASMVVGLAAATSTWAQNWQDVDLRIPAGRMGHGFSLLRDGAVLMSLGSPEVNGTLVGGGLSALRALSASGGFG